MALALSAVVPEHGSRGEWQEMMRVDDQTKFAEIAIAVTGRTTAAEIGDRVEVEWTLSATPGSEWIEVFQFVEVGDRGGAVDWRDGGGPAVVRDTVRWFVPSAALDAADAEVVHRLAVANERCGA